MDQNSIEWAIRTLRQPAGSAEEFSSIEAIQQHRSEFIKAFHSSLKELHASAITTILLMEQLIADPAKSGEPVALMHLYRQIWRRINDSIVWIMVGGQRHFIKRLCHFRTRSPLLNKGASDVTQLLDDLNKSPEGIAIWTDATSCVDVGDIIYNDHAAGRISLIEVKSGKFYKELLSLEPLYVDDLLSQYPKHGASQLERYGRQQERMLRTTEILNTDKGIDPLSGLPIHLLDCPVPDERFDEELQYLLTKAAEGNEQVGAVDQCVWIFVTRSEQESMEALSKRFRQKILERDPGIISDWLRNDLRSAEPQPVFTLFQQLYYPVSFPLFLRDLEVSHLADIASGHVHVLMLFDWGRFSEQIVQVGAEFRWSSRKDGRRAASAHKDRRPLIIGEVVPEFHLGKNSFRIGAPQFFRMLYDGIRPNCWARQAAAALRTGSEKAVDQ